VRQIRADAVVKPLILIAIVLFLWPEFFAMVELTTLLDLLGATLFVIAFAAGLQMLGSTVLQRLKKLLVPPEASMLLAIRGRPSAVAFGALYVAAHVAFFALLSWLSFNLVAGLAQLAA